MITTSGSTQYIRLGKVPAEEFLKYVPSNKSKPLIKEWCGVKIRMTNRRYVVFKRKGITCVECGLKGAYFAIEKIKSQRTDKWHCNLYSADDKMINIDHIKARAKGGKDNFRNKQPMCAKCNNKKADKY